jgi:pimeloyl-ACP methyl ester carboxylesterase
MIFEVQGRAVYGATGGQPFGNTSDAGARRAVLFLHGAGMDHSVWTSPARYVAHHGGSALAVDLPGHGGSAPPALDGIGAMADWAWHALDALAVGPAWVVGHSMGALIGLEMARSQPDRISGLMLVGFSPLMPVHPDLLSAALRNEPAAAELIASWAFGTAGQIGGNPAPGVAMLPLGLRLLQRAPSGVLHADLAACDGYRGAADAAASLRCPVLLLQGSADRMAQPRAAAAYVAQLPNSEQRLLEGVGHMVMAEAPGAMIDALRDFVLQPRTGT